MKVLNNLWTISLYSFIIVVFVMVSCSNSDSSLAKTPNREVEVKNKEVKPVEDEKAPVCYSKSDLESSDTTSLHIILKKIAEIKEVRNYSNQNDDKILYCVTETEADDVYQSNSYKVQVVLDTEDHYSTHFNFYVNKQTKEIKILEVVSDSMMSIEEWRKTNKTK